MAVTGREMHNGTDAWAISLKPDAGRPVWTLWVSAADGKPLELRDPGRDAERAAAGHPLADLRGPARRRTPTQLLTLTGAHPSARVVHDPAQVAAAAAAPRAAQAVTTAAGRRARPSRVLS